MQQSQLYGQPYDRLMGMLGTAGGLIGSGILPGGMPALDQAAQIPGAVGGLIPLNAIRRAGVR